MRVDDDIYLDTSTSPSIGEIKFDIIHITVPVKRASNKFSELPHLKMVHEKSKKAGAHRVQYVANLTLYNVLNLIPIKGMVPKFLVK